MNPLKLIEIVEAADKDFALAQVPSEILEKFAQLLVRKCMKVASPNYMSTPEDSVYYVEEAIDRIAEHFGIEE